MGRPKGDLLELPIFIYVYRPRHAEQFVNNSFRTKRSKAAAVKHPALKPSKQVVSNIGQDDPSRDSCKRVLYWICT